MAKTVSNVKAHFFNKNKAAWEQAQGAEQQEQEPQGKGYGPRGVEWSWGKPAGSKGYHGGWHSWKKEEWGKTGWGTQKD